MNRLQVALAAQLVVATVAGCNDANSLRRFAISGEITLNGQPIDEGRIVFLPDTQRGNAGPSGFATIRDGTFDTAAGGGRGTVGGPHVVRIRAAANNMDDEMALSGAVVELTEHVDLPSADAKHDFAFENPPHR